MKTSLYFFQNKLLQCFPNQNLQDDVEEDESTPLVYLKEKMTDKRISPTLSNSVLPPPPKLQMAPAAVTKG